MSQGLTQLNCRQETTTRLHHNTVSYAIVRDAENAVRNAERATVYMKA